MADILIDSVINRPAIEGEVSYVAAKVKEIEMLIAQAKTGGIQILGAQNFKEFEEAQKKLTATQQQLTTATKEAERSAIASAKAKQAEANAAKALAQQQLAETRLREANEKAANREANAVKKAEEAKSDLSKRRIEDIPFTSNVNPDGTINQPDQASAESIERANAEREEQVRIEMEAKAAMSASAQQTIASTAATNTNTKANQASTVQLSKYKDNLEELTGTLKENEEAQAAYRLEFEEVSKELKDLEKNTEGVDKSTEEYQKKLAELLGRQNELKQGSSQLSQTIKNQIKEQYSAAGSVDALRARLNLATQAYDKLSESQRTSPLGKFLKTEVVALTTAVGQQEQSIGKFQRNVGNYVKNIGVTFANGAGKVFYYVRTLANILPGVGISGIFLAIGTGIASMVKAITGADEATKKMSGSLSDLSRQADATKDAISSLNTELDNFEKLVNVNNKIRISDDFERGLSDIDASLSVTIQKFGELDSEVSSLTTSLNKIKADALKDLSGEDFLSFINAISGSGDALDELSGDLKTSAQEYKKTEGIIKELTKEREKERDAILITRRTREAFITENERKEAKKRADAAAKAAETERRAALDLFKFRQGLLIAQAKEDVALNMGSRRIAARQRLAELENELVRGVYAFEIAEANLTKSQRLKIEAEKIEGLRAINLQRLVDISTFGEMERQEALNQAEKQLKEIQAAEDKAREEKVQRDIRDAEISLEVRLQSINRNANAELLANAKLYGEGKISKEQYEMKKQRIENESLEKSIQKQIEYYTTLAFLANISAEDQRKYLDEIDKLKDQLAKLGIKRAEDSAEEETDIERKKAEGLKALAREVTGLGFDLLTAGIERQKNEVQDLIDLLEQQKQKDIEVANQTIANATERANAIAVIEARAAAQREALERRQRELNIRRARFERAEQIANIIGNTARGVSSALASLPPNIPLAILVGAIGAAQLARVLATPIPRYATGVTDFAGGYAILGDGGRHEVVVEPGKKPYLSGDSDELHHLAPGTDVYSSVQAYEKAVHKPATALKSFATTDLRPLMGTVERSSRRVERAIKRIPQTVVNSEGNWSRHVRRGNNTRSWINRNL